MNAARSTWIGRRRFAGLVVATVLLLPAAGDACPHTGGRCATSSGAAHETGPRDARTADGSAPSAGGQLNACARSGQPHLCARVEEPPPAADQPGADQPDASPRTAPATGPAPSPGSGSAPRPSQRIASEPQPATAPDEPVPDAERAPEPTAPSQPWPRTIIVSDLVEVVRERPAVAISIAAGALVAAGLFLVFVIGTRRRRRRRAEAAEQEARGAYDRLTASLIDTLSHELYTPLTPVKGYATMLKRKQLPAGTIDQLADELLGASRKLEHLFDTLVALADVERGTSDPEEDVVDLEPALRQALERAGVPEERVSLSVDAGIPSIRVNERQLTLAVAALVDNAVKFSPGGGEIRIDVRARETGGREFLDVRVSDRGIGMTAEQLRVAFDPFRQIDGSLSRRFDGLGVGLALADRVARAHRGRLLATSRPGEGSAFTISIPLIRAPRAVPVAPFEHHRAG